MFLKKYLNNFVAIVLIFFISLGSTFLIKSEFFTKKSLVVEYKFENYYLTSPGFIHGYLNIVMPIIYSDQFVVRDQIKNSKECEFLDKEINSFTIIDRPHKTYRAELFSNKNVLNKDLDDCFNSYLKAMNDQKNMLFQRILSSDIELLQGSLEIYETMLEDQDLFEKKAEILSIILKAKQDREQIFYIKKFLNFVDKSNAVYVINKRYSSFTLNQKDIFMALFAIYLVIYLIYLNLYRSKKLLKKIFS